MEKIIEILFEVLKKPFVWGLIIGFLFSLYIWINSSVKRKSLKKENKELKKHLHTKMEIDAEATEMMKDKLEKLKENNENLRITIQTLRTKPARKELELLYIYDKTLQLMFQRAPGFASAWQNTRKEIEKEISDSYKGIIPMIKRAFGVIPVLPAESIDSTIVVEDTIGEN